MSAAVFGPRRTQRTDRGTPKQARSLHAWSVGNRLGVRVTLEDGRIIDVIVQGAEDIERIADAVMVARRRTRAAARRAAP